MMPSCEHWKWIVDLPMIMCTININQEFFGLVGDTYNVIFSCVVFGLSSIWHSRLTIWNWKNFPRRWCYHKSSISLTRNWQLQSPHLCYYKNWTNDACFRNEGTKENNLDNFFTSEDTLVIEHMKFIEKQGLFKENLKYQLESIISFFCSINTWGFDFQKVLGLFVVLLMHGEMTCLSFYTFVVMLMCGGNNSQIPQPLWLCWCVQASNVGWFLVGQCLRFFFLCDCVDMRKNQQRCISTSCLNDLKKTSLKKQKLLHKKQKKIVCNS